MATTTKSPSRMIRSVSSWFEQQMELLVRTLLILSLTHAFSRCPLPSAKKKLLMLIFLMGTLVPIARAQSISVQYGNPCINGEMVFMLNGSCSSFSWGVSYNATSGTDYQIIGPSGSNSQTFRVKWLTAKSNVYVYCNYVCGTTSGNIQGSNFDILSPVTPGVSLTTVQSSPFCQGATQTLTATPTYGGSTPQYTWLVDGVNMGSTTTNSYILNTSGMIAGNHTVRVTMLSNYPCTDGSSPWSPLQNFTVIVPPSPANAGADITSSATCGVSSVTLGASTPSIGTGAWTIVSGSGGSFANATSPTTTFSGNQDVTYTLRWTTSNGTCPTSSDDMQVLMHRPPTVANAGTDLNGFITCGVTSLALQANAPSAGTGAWSIISGSGGTIASPSNPNSTFSGVAGNTYTLRWTTSKSPCASTSDDVIVTFNNWPTNSNAGPDQTNSATCGATSVTLAGNSPAIGTGTWSIFNGGTGTFSNASSPTSTFTGTPGATYTLQWVISNSPCLTKIDYVDVKINSLPVATPTVANNARFGAGPLTVTGGGASGGETYEWNVSGTITLGSSLGISNAPQGGVTNYGTVSIVSAAGCKRTSSFNLVVYDNPVITTGSPYVYLGSSSTLSTGVYDSYLWSNSATTQSISTTTAGVYTVTVTKGSLSKTSDPFTLQTQLGGVDQNYIQAFSPQTAGVDPSTILLAPVQTVSQTIQYFDGLGRPLQTVSVQSSPLKEDLVQPVIYDQYGREEKKYLPFVAENTGRYKDNTAIINPSTGDYQGIAEAFYDTPSSKVADDDDNVPFSKTVFEPSPLGRIIKQGAPGAAWQPDPTNTYASTDHTVKLRFETNASNEVLNWTYTPPTGAAAFGTVDASANYGADELVKNSTKDENGKQVIEYVNHEGNVVLKRVQATDTPTPINDVNYASTYYIYDDLRQLVCVIQPEGTKRITQTTSEYVGKTTSEKELFLQRWAFRYRYDNTKRMILKQVPGADSIRMVYDQRDRLVFTQDGNQRLTHKWSFTKYDLLNRPIITGEYTHGSAKTQSEMTGLISASVFGETFNVNATSNHGYTANTLANFAGTFEVLAVTYYDDHSFKQLVTSPEFTTGDIDYLHNHVTGQYVVPATTQSFARVRGQVTGTKTRILGSNNFLWSINYYDDRYRVVQNISSNHKGGFDRATSIYDFTGKVKKTKMSHKVGSIIHTIEREFDYDHAGRLTKTWHKVDARPKVILSAMEYNELGQLVTKKLHASADNSIDEEGTTYSNGIIETSQYNNEKNIIANTRVVIKPGFTVPAGKVFKASTENQWTEANSNPPDASYAQVVDYRYNIRGWMTKINDVDAANENELFAMKLNYTASTLGGVYDQFNGNISEAIWTTTGLDKQSYGYKYDAMNRLREGNYFNMVDGSKNGRYSEHIVGNATLDSRPYDMNGNINGLKRWGKRADGNFALMDELTYTYTGTGNQLSRVDDAMTKFTTEEGFKENEKVANEYLYDRNGNMNKDRNKGIEVIRYNLLNLPRIVKKSATDSLEYVYDATGRKLRQQVFGSKPKITDYAGEFFYENDTLKFLNHEEGRALMTTAVPAYEYFLKDHLGNTRVSFKAITEMTEYKTDFESATNATFGNYSAGVRSPMNLFDHTDAGTVYTYSQLLTGGNNSQVGAAKSFEVMPGDVFDAEVFAKYLDAAAGPANTMSTLFSALSAAFNFTVPSGSGLESVAAKNKFQAMYGTGSFIGTGDPENLGAPKAFINYILFDESFNLLDFGFDQVDASGAQTLTGPVGSHDQMAIHIQVQKKGYLYIFISNESPNERSVYFDDMKIVRHTYVESVNDYYPFGLAFNSYSRENSIKQNYLYNGKELQDELSLGWYDYQARQYDPAIARWMVIDPLADKMRRWSPYNYVYNNPLRYVDPDGMNPDDPPGFLQGVVNFFRNLIIPPENEDDGQGQQSRQRVFNNFSKTVQDAREVQRNVIGVLPGGGVLNAIIDNDTNGKSQGAIAADLTFEAGVNLLLPIGGSAGKKIVGDLIENSIETNISKTVVSKVVGTLDDAAEKFKGIIGDAEVKTVTNKAGQEIKTATMKDGTTVTLRSFSSSEKNANAVIQLNNKELQKQGAKPVEIKFFNE